MNAEQTINIKDTIGNPRVVFVIGGACAGKVEQCSKLVEEFGYTHISTGALLRKEMEAGTKEADRIRKLMCDGGIIPYETVVQCIANAMQKNPSQNYIIDGFPRAVDQAQYFEQNICEVQMIIELALEPEEITKRLTLRCQTSERPDDREEIVKKRLTNYIDHTSPMFDYYRQFGKVRTVNANQDSQVIYNQLKTILTPQTTFLIGPKASGKTTLGKQIAERTNMVFMNFNDFVKKNHLKGKDDETVVLALIKSLSYQIEPRLLIEGFPQNEFQARLFVRNTRAPQNVFVLNCSKDVSQERIDSLGSDSATFVNSGVLSQSIKDYNDKAKELVPYLKASTNCCEINTETTVEKCLSQIYKHLEPTVIHIRPGASSNELRKDVTDQLSKHHGYTNLDINALIRDENERKTAIGQEINSMIAGNKIIPADMIVRMLKKIIYSGDVNQKHFILTGFPDIIEQAREFELNCCSIKCIIYCTAKGSKTVEIKNNNLSLFNIDSLFQKEFRLKTMSNWDFQEFQEKMGQTIEFGVCVGNNFSGKSIISRMLKNKFGFKCIEMKTMEAKIKASLGTEEEPFEGEVPISKVEDAVLKFIEDEMKSGEERNRFVFDGFTHKTPEQFLAFCKKIGNQPSFVVSLKLGEAEFRKRYAAANEVEISEELAEELKAKVSADVKLREAMQQNLADSKVNFISVDANASIETCKNVVSQQFMPRVLLANHEKRLGIDTTCSNLALKYDMIYISAYQLIKQHVTQQTEWGKKLVATQRIKDIQLTTQVRDEFNELEYSPVHFDQSIVLAMIRDTIKTKMTSQKIVLLEGLCNSTKLTNQEDQLEVRLMDEVLAIEQHIGSISGTIGLQFAYVVEKPEPSDIKYEKFEPKAPVDASKPAEAPAEGEEPPAEDEAPKKVSSFKPEEFQWTASNKQQKTLPEFFLSLKGKTAVHEVKPADAFSASQYEAISKSLDEFCQRISTKPDEFVYQQVIFSE